jgi:hypothetical protein
MNRDTILGPCPERKITALSKSCDYRRNWLLSAVCYYCSVPGKGPLPGKRPCIAFQGVNVAASNFISRISTHVGQNRELCLSAHGHLPGTLG